jgi:sigma-E factor negative regulatory protein RseB
VISPFCHWRVASAATVFVLAGSSAVLLAVHARPAGTAVAYRSWPVPSATPAPARRSLAARRTATAREGLALMNQAVAACRATAFSGIEVSRWWRPGRALIWRADIWHRPGAQMVAEALSDPMTGPAESRAAMAEVPGPSVTMVISARQLALLQAGYVLTFSGNGTADGRPAELVAASRPDGTLAAEYWLDRQTGLPLRRQLFDRHARMVSDVSVTDLRVGAQALGSMPAAGDGAQAGQLSAVAIAALRARGWPLPGQLPRGMMLFAASEAATQSGPVVGLSYSDGLSVISLFVQRGELPAALSGWQRVAIGGQDAYAVDPDDQTIAWSGDGYVFTLIADAPQDTVGQAVAALPHSGSPGFWGRLGRGFRRLISWANPFR